MKYFFTLFLICAVSACKKSSDPIAQLKSSLTANSSRAWKLKKIFINGTEQSLTSGQLLYNKTYDMDGSWRDTDGYSGKYEFVSTTLMRETTTVGGSYSTDFKINSLKDNVLDIEYSFNQQTYRFVYAP